jgi:hypothetical protein
MITITVFIFSKTRYGTSPHRHYEVMRNRSGVLALTLPLTAALLAASAWSSSPAASNATAASTAKITAIGAENEYADVIAQAGGKYVQASAVMSNPNTDPHTFEASPAVAREISGARLIVQNGAGYDGWATTIDNQQVTDALTESYIKLAQQNGIPVVGVYETMPTTGFDYQSWMTAEVSALNKAVTSQVSTQKL